MDKHRHPLTCFARFLRRNFIWFLLGSYVVAAVAPQAGLTIKNVSLGRYVLFGEHIRVSLPMLMLAMLLFNAGLGIQTAHVRRLLRRPWGLIVALAANLCIPLTYIFAVSWTIYLWHDPDEVQTILVGLALVAAMPIAASSATWTQNVNGDLSLSLGLVLFSTLLSPLTTPICFDLVEHMAEGKYARILDSLETQGGGAFLGICVVLPSLLGMAGRGVLGKDRTVAAKPMLKVVNLLNLLVLNYSNASVSLPQAVAHPDWDFLAMILIVVVGMCLTAFTVGWLVSRLFRVELSQRISLMFGLGMNNTGTGLVLATVALPHYPRVMLPIILYKLVQHLVAGSVDFMLFRRTPSEGPQLAPDAAIDRIARNGIDSTFTQTRQRSA